VALLLYCSLTAQHLLSQLAHTIHTSRPPRNSELLSLGEAGVAWHVAGAVCGDDHSRTQIVSMRNDEVMSMVPKCTFGIRSMVGSWRAFWAIV
jgi:hypothetical protein